MTHKGLKVLSYIEGYIMEQGASPSYEEIANGLGYRSIATVHKHVMRLVSERRIKLKYNQARSIEIARGSRASGKAIRDVVNATIAEVRGRDEHEPEPVNWDRVHCSDVEHVESLLTGTHCTRVTISPAAPAECRTLCAVVRGKLDMAGYPDVEVVTEW